MTITNRHGLPEVLVRAVQFDPGSKEDRGDISVTGLLSPPRLVTLRKRHYRDITEDVSERIWALTGQMGHEILQRAVAGGMKAVVEQRFSVERLGWRITGRVDRVETDGAGTVIDWKWTKAYGLKEGGKAEWEAQLNLYALLCRENGLPVDRLQNIVFVRDWTAWEAKKDQRYPHAELVVFDYEPWPDDQAERYLLDRIMAHQAARKRLPECTADERWERKGKWTRCERYCPCAKFCVQFEQFKEHGPYPKDRS